MPTHRDDVRATLAGQPAAELRAILHAAGLGAEGGATPAALAERITAALWWHATSPLGYYTQDASLEQLVAGAARRLGVSAHVDAEQDAWQQLQQLTRALVTSLPSASTVTLDDLDAATRQRIEPRWRVPVALGLGSGGSLGAALLAGRALGFLRGPIGRLLPLLPPLAPYYRALLGGLGAARVVAWPLGVALAVLSVDRGLGPDDRRVVPLLLGIGALGPTPVSRADEL